MIAAVERLAIVGCIGAGKSTLARVLGGALNLPVVHLDRHWWTDGEYLIEGPSTVKARTMPVEEYHRFQEDAAAGDRWVIDGGVDGLDLRLARADTAIFLDLPTPLCAWRSCGGPGNRERTTRRRYGSRGGGRCYS